MKKLIVSIIIICIIQISNFSFAQQSIWSNDCALVTNTQDIQNDYSNILNKYDQIIPSPATAKALENLKAYCCKSKQPISSDLRESCQGFNPPDIYPQSQYLYDQLIDIILKRLDAIPSSPYGLSADTQGLERRQYLENFMKQNKGSRPDSLTTTFQQYRSSKNPISYDEKICNIIQEQGNSNMTLLDKYNSTCTIARCIYKDISDKQFEWSAYDKCQNMVRNRVQAEFTLTQKIMMQQAINLLQHTIHAYAVDYFSTARLSSLQNTLQIATNDLYIVNKSVVEWTKQCSI
jgi:hypothetical protein